MCDKKRAFRFREDYEIETLFTQVRLTATLQTSSLSAGGGAGLSAHSAGFWRGRRGFDTARFALLHLAARDRVEDEVAGDEDDDCDGGNDDWHRYFFVHICIP